MRLHPQKFVDCSLNFRSKSHSRDGHPQNSVEKRLLKRVYKGIRGTGKFMKEGDRNRSPWLLRGLCARAASVTASTCRERIKCT